MRVSRGQWSCVATITRLFLASTMEKHGKRALYFQSHLLPRLEKFHSFWCKIQWSALNKPSASQLKINYLEELMDKQCKGHVCLLQETNTILRRIYHLLFLLAAPFRGHHSQSSAFISASLMHPFVSFCVPVSPHP